MERETLRTPPILPPFRRVNLPSEVISIIAGFADRPTLVAVAAVSRSVRQLCEALLWAELYLTLPAAYGKQPTALHSTGPEDDSSATPVQTVEEIWQSKMRDMVRDILIEGTRRRWTAVRSAKLLVIPDALHGLLSVLDLVSSNIGALDLIGPDYREHPYRARDTLEFRMMVSKPSLPSLTSLRIGTGVVRYVEFLPYLFTIAPNLVSLDLASNQFFRKPLRIGPVPEYPDWSGETKLERLRLEVYADFEDAEGDMTGSAILPLLKRCPAVRQLSFSFGADADMVPSWAYREVLGVIAQYEDLEDLYWPDDPEKLFYWEVCSFGTYPFYNLRRIVLDMRSWTDIFKVIPQISSLEMLYFHRHPYEAIPYSSQTSAGPPSLPQAMIPMWSHFLRESPNLRIIHVAQKPLVSNDLDFFTRVDELEAAGNFTGYVNSICHKSSEVLHARLLLDQYEVSDDPFDGIVPSELYSRRAIHYEAYYDESPRVKRFEQRPEATWQTFTEYKGEVVPLEVIEEVKRVEGDRVVDWNQRGVEVSAEAWKVVQDWYKSVY